jgi:23S rRNA (cytosine1962-C5)-methyltransferase
MLEGTPILEDDGALVVVDKPSGVSVIAAEPSRRDDLVFRLERGLGVSWLGVHQRLDRDTSGVCVFARTREASRALAPQFEGRLVRKRYVAAVDGWPAGGKREETLRDLLVEGTGGRIEVVARGVRDPRAKEAIAHLRLRERCGTRALVELDLVTGRTHQARVQLAHRGCAVAGDPLYGTVAAPRLLLHAAELGLVHPDGRARTYRAPLPRVFTRWLRGDFDDPAAVYDDEEELRERVALAVRRRFGLGHAAEGPRKTTAFRLVHGAGDGLSGVAVDVYGDHAVVQFSDDGSLFSDRTRVARVVNAIAALGFDGVYVKHRPKQANVIVDARLEAFAPKTPAEGEAAPPEFAVWEDGLAYGVRLADGLSTGLFMDQRDNRHRLRAVSGGARMLNLFAYTCAFSVAAMAGGALSTTNVDASTVVLTRGRENLERNAALGLFELGEGTQTFVAEDVFRFLARQKARRAQWDLIVVDPPSYSTTKSGRFSIASDYGTLVEATVAVAAPGARILASCNYRKLTQDRFRKIVRDACVRAGRQVVQLKDLPAPSDYPTPVGEVPHLKAVLLTVGGIATKATPRPPLPRPRAGGSARGTSPRRR